MGKNVGNYKRKNMNFKYLRGRIRITSISRSGDEKDIEKDYVPKEYGPFTFPRASMIKYAVTKRDGDVSCSERGDRLVSATVSSMTYSSGKD